MEKSDSGSLAVAAAVLLVPLTMAALALLQAMINPPPKQSLAQKFFAWLRERKEIFQYE
jgi:hypothetical protein